MNFKMLKDFKNKICCFVFLISRVILNYMNTYAKSANDTR